MDLKHTPGPWCADFGPASGHPYYYILAGSKPMDDAAIVAHVRAETKVGPSGEESRANAQLVSAAPELLDDLMGLLDALDSHGYCGHEALRAAGRETIARATGSAKP